MISGKPILVKQKLKTVVMDTKNELSICFITTKAKVEKDMSYQLGNSGWNLARFNPVPKAHNTNAHASKNDIEERT